MIDASVDSYRYAGIRELRRSLRSGRASAVGLAEEALRLLETVGVSHHGVIELDRERTIAAARRADRARAGSEALPPLLGIPYGIKDLVSAQSTACRRLARAGAVLAGHLAVENGGFGWAYLAGIDSARDRPAALNRMRTRDFGRNPWNPARWAGGSSSGSAIAVAAGALPFALGTETSGSIAWPAAYCGLTGIRPTMGAISLDGVAPATRTMDKVGVLGRTVEDCIEVLAVLAGPVERPSIRGLRVGYAAEDFLAARPETRAALGAALSDIGRLGRALVPVRLADLDYAAMIATVQAAEGSALYGTRIEGDDLDHWVEAPQAARLRAALGTTARAYLEAMASRDRLGREFASLFDTVDVLVAPTVEWTAPPIADVRERRTRGGVFAEARPSAVGAGRLIAAGNLAGLPAVFVPCGLAADGMPVGLQIVGPRRSEGLLAAVGARYQRATDHHERRPHAAR